MELFGSYSGVYIEEKNKRTKSIRIEVLSRTGIKYNKTIGPVYLEYMKKIHWPSILIIVLLTGSLLYVIYHRSFGAQSGEGDWGIGAALYSVLILFFVPLSGAVVASVFAKGSLFLHWLLIFSFTFAILAVLLFGFNYELIT